MSTAHSIDLRACKRFVDETANLLMARIARGNSASVPIAGWHNFFRPGRIGTTGSAFPLLFLDLIGFSFQYRTEVLNGIRTSQASDGGWAILSVSTSTTVEGTAWPVTALYACGSPSDGEQILRGTQWLISNQATNGGWGSNFYNPPRTLHTCIALETMVKLRPYDQGVVNRAIHWLSVSQRENGSWGPEPNQDGTVFHTARVICALTAAGISINDSRIQRANEFMDATWRPTSTAIQQELYDIYVGAAYSRVTLEHDTDAFALIAVIRTAPAWAVPRVVKTVQAMLRDFSANGTVHPSGIPPSLWNIIPRAIALHEFRTAFPLTREATVYFGPNAFAVTSSPPGRRRIELVRFTLDITLRPFLSFNTLILTFITLVTGTIVFLYSKGSIDGKDVLLSLVVELTGVAIGIWIDRRKKR